MSHLKEDDSGDTILRHRKAEALLKKKLSKTAWQLSESETHKLIHELEVHQVELELQNDELMLARSAAQDAIEKYTELYDCAPSGYFTLSKEGKILELNLCGSQMLGKERAHLKNSNFGFFVSSDSKPIFKLFLAKVFNSRAKETSEVTLSLNGNTPVYIHLTGKVTQNGKQCHLILVEITERKRAEKIFQDFLEKNPMSIQIVDKEGYTLKVNPAHTKLFGSVPPSGFSIFTDLQNKNLALEKLILLAKSGEIVHLPDLYYNANDVSTDLPNVPVWIRATIFPLKDDDGKPERFVVMHENITEKKQAEKALVQQNEALLKLNHFSIELAALSSQDNLEVLIVKRIKEFVSAEVAMFSEYNSENRTTTVKHIEMEPGLFEKVVSLLGKQVKKFHAVVSDDMYREMTTEIIGLRKTLYEASFGEISRPVGAAIQALLKVDRFIGVAYLIEGKLYGTSLLGMSKDQPDPPRKMLENFIFLAAVTLRRKNAEEALKISEGKYRNIFENVQDVFYQTDLAGKILEISPSIKYFSEFNRDELLGTSVYNLYENTDDRDLLLNAIMKNHELRDYELKIKTKTGVLKNISINASLVFDADRKPSYINGALRDITQRKKAEFELIKAKEKAEESDRLKTSFLQNISHEIRTPMNAIVGFSKMLDKPDLSKGKIKSFTNIIIQCSDQLLSIVTDILTISSLETNQEKINIQKVCINDIILDLLDIFKLQALKQNVSLSAKQPLTDKQSETDTDKTKVTQILMNLLTNALKFTHEGFIEFGYNKKGKELEFYVKDNGIGIKAEMQEIIFNRFRQANFSISQDYGGNGLGLAISKGFVELLGGKIWVESFPDKGSTFYFTLPYKSD